MKKYKKTGFTLIELLIVIAIIGILASIAIPMYKSQTIKAKMTEVINSISYVASISSSYFQENGHWPTAGNIDEVQNSLGVFIPRQRISQISAHMEGNYFVIRATIKDICNNNPSIDGNDLTLSANTSNGRSIVWIWGGDPELEGFIPRN